MPDLVPDAEPVPGRGQLPLPVQLRPEASFDEFVAGPNELAVAAARAFVEPGSELYLYLFGAAGTGKTHLLHAVCRAASAGRRPVSYLPLGDPGLTPAILDGLDQMWLVALDDVQRIAGDRAWERGLFGLFNRLREGKRRLLVSADCPAAELPLDLADLRSRLSWGPGFRLRALDDSDCETLLRHAARRRGLELGDSAISYIMRRSPRDVRALIAVLDDLDQASLREQRRPTVPFIRALLEGGDSDQSRR
ncbi:DnaA regulatory inactivator Hda [Thioalkalicoccus limnaeus]|uniref:DnaA regulatory inactivator Hda n=1 Tax=Thioalkalicoccus limnaeus TaxID=120681 RepID=A0ABV4BH18_9GAMM